MNIDDCLTTPLVPAGGGLPLSGGGDGVLATTGGGDGLLIAAVALALVVVGAIVFALSRRGRSRNVLFTAAGAFALTGLVIFAPIATAAPANAATEISSQECGNTVNPAVGTKFVTPVAPNVVDGEIVYAVTKGVTYIPTQISDTQWYVTAYVEDGYVFTDGAVTEWLIDTTQFVTPVMPTVVDGQIVMAVTKGVQYIPTQISPVLWDVTAYVQEGYALSDGATTQWLIDTTQFATPVMPTVVDGQIVMAVTKGVQYIPTQISPVLWDVTAYAEEGYVLTAGAQSVWLIDTTQTVTPVAPTVVDGQIVMPVTKGVQYIPTQISPVLWDVTAYAEEGYALTSGAQSVWLIDTTQFVTPVAPTVVDGKIVYAVTKGVTYIPTQITGTQWYVTAHADEGYAFPAGAKTEWLIDTMTATA